MPQDDGNAPDARQEGFGEGQARAIARMGPAEQGMVPRRGLEPPQCCHRQDLNLVRLPIPPSGQPEPAILR